jgi:glycosyltransferase involved in cell wall biosynthesis
MRVLHLVSNHKLTGPVDPAVRLATALADLGLRSEVAVGRGPWGGGPIDDLVRDRGIEPLTDFLLPKHRRLFANLRDVRRLAERIAAAPVDVLHAHLDNAHGVALRARALARRRGGLPAGTLVVRSLYDDHAPAASVRYRRLLGVGTDGVFVFSEAVRREVLGRFGLPPERVVTLQGAVLADRFRPRDTADDVRARFGIPPDAVVVGIVARIQRHRRFPVLFEAMRRVMAELPQVYLLVLGRGTHAKEIAHDTVARLGIGERTRLAGYVGGEEYPRALATFDLKVFLVPGSDGTCRAVREAMASGVPVVAARRGMLPEIVRDGVDGLIVEDEVEPLAAAIRRLSLDGELRRRMGENARRRAREEFSQEAQARRVLDAYTRWLYSSGHDAANAQRELGKE